jgi:hypothetical protein
MQHGPGRESLEGREDRNTVKQFETGHPFFCAVASNFVSNQTSRLVVMQVMGDTTCMHNPASAHSIQ